MGVPVRSLSLSLSLLLALTSAAADPASDAGANAVGRALMSSNGRANAVAVSLELPPGKPGDAALDLSIACGDCVGGVRVRRWTAAEDPAARVDLEGVTLDIAPDPAAATRARVRIPESVVPIEGMAFAIDVEITQTDAGGEAQVLRYPLFLRLIEGSLIPATWTDVVCEQGFAECSVSESGEPVMRLKTSVVIEVSETGGTE